MKLLLFLLLFGVAVPKHYVAQMVSADNIPAYSDEIALEAPVTPPADETKALVIGFAQVGSESDWRRAHTNSIREESAKRGIDLHFADGQQMQENQIRAVKKFISEKVDAIILAPVVETGWEPVLKQAKAAGIPVILSDRAVQVSDPSLIATRVGMDFTEEGRMAARWLAKSTDGKCRIVELQGTTGSAPAIQRHHGFMEILKQYPDMKVIKSTVANFRMTDGRNAMAAIIKSQGKSIQAVFAHNDDMAIGAIEALKSAGYKPGKKIKVVSIDAVKAAFQAMIAGDLNASVECSPLFGPQLFDACEKAIKGEKLPKLIFHNEQVFDQSNAQDFIEGRPY